MTLDPKEAEAVIAHLMQEAKGSVLNQDFARFEAICHLPLETGSFEAREVWRTRAELKKLFTQFVAYYAKNGITNTIRKLISMQPRGDDVIVCTHESWHIAANKLLSNSMTGFTEIQRRGGVWAVTHSYYASQGSARFDATLVQHDTACPARGSEPNTETPEQEGENHG